MLDVAIIGAGPYGISLAAHAQAYGLRYEIFGYPMDFWKNKMPPEMFIRTSLDYLGLSDPEELYTLERYAFEKQLQLQFPLTRNVWIDYAFWFADQNNISFTGEHITRLIPSQEAFMLETETGRKVAAKQVVVAVGLSHAEYIPDLLRPFYPNSVTHTSGYTDYRQFAGHSVVVLGGGQSAWEAAALLHQAGAQVELVYRGSGRKLPIPHINEMDGTDLIHVHLLENIRHDAVNRIDLGQIEAIVVERHSR